jgi:D-aminoacyl-tRNA deacylase
LQKVCVTLSTADPVGSALLDVFKEMGFEQADRRGVMRRGDVYLVVVEHPIVPAEGFSPPEDVRPFPGDYDGIARELGISYYVIAYRHASKSGAPCLTAHASGNFGEALYGGRPRELQRVIARPMRGVFLKLLENPPEGYSVSLEATHHSPTGFETPMFFVEIGSTERHWRDPEAVRHLAEAIIEGVTLRQEAPVAIGFGGGHYCPKFTELEVETAFGHICPKYALDHLDEGLIRQMVEKTIDGVEIAVLDRGMKGRHRKRIEEVLRGLEIEIERR